MQISLSINVVLTIAANEVANSGYKEIEPAHLFIGILKFSELEHELEDIVKNFGQLGTSNGIKKEILDINNLLYKSKINSRIIRNQIRKRLGNALFSFTNEKMHRSKETKKYFQMAEPYAFKNNVFKINAPVILQVILDNPFKILKEILGNDNEDIKVEVYEKGEQIKKTESESKGIGKLSSVLKKLRESLIKNIFGQDHAIHIFVEGLFNAELTASSDIERKKPKGLFIFTGPPGVGKTYLAEQGAKALERPFKRFDMSSFSGHESSVTLIGMHPSYKGAHSGTLTEFVEKNPNAVLLFDEIEKAHINIIHLFLQILDAGSLEDKFTEKTILFKDTIIIFTSNAGKILYDKPNSSGVHQANSSFHRKTILNALENETDQRTGKPFFPQAICSRMATGYPVMFNHLTINDLNKVASLEFEKTGKLLEKEYKFRITYDPFIPLSLILKEGGKTDARTIRSQTESFLKTEIFKFSKLFSPEKLDSIFKNSTEMSFEIDQDELKRDEIKSLFKSNDKPEILLISDEIIGKLWGNVLQDFNWHFAGTSEDILNILDSKEIDIVLLDLWVSQSISGQLATMNLNQTIQQFEFTPPGAKSVSLGQKLLMTVHTKDPNLPCYLISFSDNEDNASGIDDELFLACVRSGGARGSINCNFVSNNVDNWKESADIFQKKLYELYLNLYIEKKVGELAKEKKCLSFMTAPRIDMDNKKIRIRLRDLSFKKIVDASDYSGIIQDVDKPITRFDDVIGGDSAKTELSFIVKWLKNPKKYKQMGLKPPKGILLYGVPGTGKTMFARALAGESNVAFIVESATNFVTKWQGSGPQNVRDLFEKARKYAPAILFIDEIDAVGKKRTGGAGGNASIENTLNAILTEMDGFGEKNDTSPVIVIAATNLIEVLDDALRRRFSREIEVERPDKKAREKYLNMRLFEKKGSSVSKEVINRLSGQTSGMTIADIERIVEHALRMSSDSDGIVTDKIIEEAFESKRMGEARSGRADEKTLLRIARHEAGHCLIGWLRGEKPVQISIMARGNAGGFVERVSDEEKMIHTKSDLEGMICQSMGGRAAEIIYYGENEGLSSGVSGDLKSATHYAGIMVQEYGMGEKTGQIYLGKEKMNNSQISIDVITSIEKIINNQLEYGIKILTSNKEYMDKLISELLEKNRLTTAELELILPKISLVSSNS